MLEVGQELSLATELLNGLGLALGIAGGHGHFFDRHQLVQSLNPSQIHGPHTTLTQDRLDLVTTGQGGSRLQGGCVHAAVFGRICRRPYKSMFITRRTSARVC